MSSFTRYNQRAQNPKGTKISVHTSQLLTSTGVSSLDGLLGGGIPLSHSLLLKQDRHSGYSHLLFKYFMAQGLCSDHEILLISLDQKPEEILADLMQVVQGKEPATEEQVFIPFIPARTMGSLRSPRAPGTLRSTLQSTPTKADNEKMTIAWRYENQPALSTAIQDKEDLNYCNIFDLTKPIQKERLEKAKVTPISASAFDKTQVYEQILNQVKTKLQEPQFALKGANVLRIAIHSLASPSWPLDSVKLYSFLHSLKLLMRDYNVVAMITSPAYLYNDFYARSSNPMIKRLEHASDAVLEIESFQGSIAKMNEKALGEFQGFVHVVKMFRFGHIRTSRMGIVAMHSLAFKVRRKRFLIETFTLPPEEEEEGQGCSDKKTEF